MNQTTQIKFHKDKYIKHHYIITLSNIEIGTINFIKRNNIIIIQYLGICSQYRNNHYGYKIIKYILSHYKIKCIIGETLYTSRGFWNKCIHKYNGQRKYIHYCDNCSSSFVIPKYPITNNQIYNYLEEVYWRII